MKKIMSITLTLMLIILLNGCNNIVKNNEGMVSSISGDLKKTEQIQDDPNYKEQIQEEETQDEMTENETKESKDEVNNTQKNNNNDLDIKENKTEKSNTEQRKSNLEGTWPSCEIANKITKPCDGFIRTFIEEENKCAIYVSIEKEECIDYAKMAAEDGFSYDSEKYNAFVNGQSNEVQFGKNDGSSFNLSYAGGLLTIRVFGSVK